MSRIKLLLGLAGALAISVEALAQGEQYGSIAGQIHDAGGQALPGVTVTVSGPSLQGVRTTVSSDEGRYRITPLPSGEYSLTAELAGFPTQRVGGVVVNIGSTTDVEVGMQSPTFAESVEVTAERIVVDTTKSTVDTVVDSRLADVLPTNRQFTSLMEMAPTVVSGSAGGYSPLVGGQSNTANLYLVDGVDTTDPRVLIYGTVINWDSIAEAQLQTAGFAAEYGRATGGILNLVTKSGGNDLHFTVRVDRSDPDWSARDGIDDESGQNKAGGARPEEWRPSVTIGGPILKDRLWFYSSYEHRDEETQYRRYETLDDLIAGRLSEGPFTNSGHYGSFKLTWQINPSHNLVAFYNDDPTEQSPLQAGIYGAIYNAATERKQEMGGSNYSLRWSGMISDALFLEANYQNHSQRLNTVPISSTFNSVPYTYDLYWGYASGGPSIDYRSDRDRKGGLASGTYFLDSRHGSHKFKAGVEYAKIENTFWNIWNDAGQYWNWQGYPYIRFLYRDQSGGRTTPQDYYSLYVQDQWTIGKLTLNLGLRAESSSVSNNQDTKVVKFGFSEMIAPRLGFAYDLNGDSVHGSIGRFYNMINNYIGDSFHVSPDHVQRWDWNYACDPAAAAYYQHPDACWTLLYDIPRYAGGTTIDPNLSPPYMTEVSLGYDRRLTNELAASIGFLWRWQDDQIDWYDPTASGYILITNVPKESDVGNLKWSEYQAVSVGLLKRYGKDRIQFIANYTYAFKNDAWGVTWRDLGFYTFSNPELVDPQRYGRTHSPHQFKFNGSYSMPWNTVVGLSAYWDSGTLYTATTAGTYGAVFTEKRGASRVGNNWEANLYVEQPFKLGPLAVSVYAQVFDLFNNQQVTGRASNSDLATFGQPVAWQSPRRVQLGFKLSY